MKQLYWLNAALLAAHLLESACAREWEVARLPGGAGALVLLAVVAFLLLLRGYAAVVAERKDAIRWTLGLAAAGILVAAFRGEALWSDGVGQRSWASLAVIGAIAVVSLLQLAVARFELRVRQRSAGNGKRVYLELR